MGKIVVHYLPIRARAEPIKMLLTYAGEDFEVDTFTYADMKERCKGMLKYPSIS